MEKLKDSDKSQKEELPSAVEDCANVTSKYERLRQENEKPQFPPVEYEKPPHF